MMNEEPMALNVGLTLQREIEMKQIKIKVAEEQEDLIVIAY